MPLGRSDKTGTDWN